jgi:hypothetical protein
MANILIAMITLIIGFILVSYGAYSNYYAAKRTFVSTAVSNALERQLIYVDMSKSDLGRFPSVSDMDSNRFSKENRDGVVYSYGTTGSYGYICARAPRTQSWVDEGFERARGQWPNALYGGDCDTNTGPSSTHVSVTIRIS